MSDNTINDQHWMQQALQLAEKAQALGEVPVGAIIVLDNKIIAKGYNQPIASHDCTAHAEINALRKAGQKLGNYRLLNTTLYVTLEPCAMCANAMVHARVKRLVYGASDPKTGAAGSVFNLVNNDKLNHQIICESGVLRQQCGELLQAFFRAKR